MAKAKKTSLVGMGHFGTRPQPPSAVPYGSKKKKAYGIMMSMSEPPNY